MRKMIQLEKIFITTIPKQILNIKNRIIQTCVSPVTFSLLHHLRNSSFIMSFKEENIPESFEDDSESFIFS
jgi:hypothetical protein